jgi:hypothetical protein
VQMLLDQLDTSGVETAGAVVDELE